MTNTYQSRSKMPTHPQNPLSAGVRRRRLAPAALLSALVVSATHAQDGSGPNR